MPSSPLSAMRWLIGTVSLLTRAKILPMLGLLLATGAGLTVHPPASHQPVKEKSQANAPPAPEAKRPLVDRFGDPLPEGALARLGTMRFRHPRGTSLAFAADGKTLRTCGEDRMIRTWDAVSSRLLRQQRIPAEPWTPVFVLSPDGRMLGYQDASMETFCLWDVELQQMRHKLPLGEKGWHQAVFSPDGKTLVAAPKLVDNANVRAWDVASGKARLSVRLQQYVNLNTLSLTADSKHLIAVGTDRKLRAWSLESGLEESCRKLPEHI